MSFLKLSLLLREIALPVYENVYRGNSMRYHGPGHDTSYYFITFH